MIFIQNHLRRKCSRFRPCSHPNRLIDNLGMVLMVVQGQCFHSIGQLIPCMWSHYQSNQHQYSSRQYRHFYPFCQQLLSRFVGSFRGKLNTNDKLKSVGFESRSVDFGTYQFSSNQGSFAWFVDRPSRCKQLCKCFFPPEMGVI